MILPFALTGHAGVVKLVDAPDSKSGSARSVGSIPTARTTILAHALSLYDLAHYSAQHRTAHRLAGSDQGPDAKS